MPEANCPACSGKVPKQDRCKCGTLANHTHHDHPTLSLDCVYCGKDACTDPVPVYSCTNCGEQFVLWQFRTIETRIQDAIEDAGLAFWAVIAQKFSEAKSGDFPPDAHFAWERAMKEAVTSWVTGNVPGVQYAGGGTLNLIQHTKDSDCTLDPETDCCTICGVDHSTGCSNCGGRGFHKPDCQQMKEVSQ